MPPRILYVDLAPSPGGSIYSLLQILEHLPRQRFQPLALLSPQVAALPACQALGIPLFSLDAGQGQALALGPRGERLRSSPAGQRLREHPRLGHAWRWGSIGQRLWRRTWPTAAATGRLIRQHQIDLVHLNDALPLAEPGILAAWRWRRPSVVTVRSFTPLDPFHGLISRLPAAGLFTSRPLLLDQRRQGARFRRQEILPNAIDLARFQGEPDRDGVRAGLGLPLQARIACVVGRLMRRKGLDVFIRAVAQVAPDFPDLHGLIVGAEEITDTGLERELRQLAADLGVSARIHFTGFRDDVPRLLLAADLLSFAPTEPEPFGRLLIEAMAAGLPVVGGRSGAIPDIVAEGETGLLVPPADPAAQATAIRRLLADPAAAQAMGAAGKRRAALYSIDHHIQRLTALYDALL